MINPKKIPIEVSARHLHLSKKELEELFGKGYNLSVSNKISQPGQFAAKETVNIINGDRRIDNVRVVGPIRKETQIELSKTDAIKLRINPPLRVSGDIKGSPGITIENKNKKIKVSSGVIIAKRHLHISEKQGNELGLKDKDIISIKVNGERGVVFDNVVVRKGDENEFSFQLDTDEGNAAGITPGMFGEIVNR